MGRTNLTGLAGPGFVADYHSMILNTGRQIDWAAVPAGYVDASSGKKIIRGGTAMSELASGKIVPRVDRDIVANPTETAIGFLVSDAVEDEKSAALTGYGMVVGGLLYEQLLPDHEDAEFGAIVAEVDAAGTGIALEQYADDRAS